MGTLFQENKRWEQRENEISIFIAVKFFDDQKVNSQLILFFQPMILIEWGAFVFVLYFFISFVLWKTNFDRIGLTALFCEKGILVGLTVMFYEKLILLVLITVTFCENRILVISTVMFVKREFW